MDSTRRNQAFGEASSIRYVVPFGIATYTFFRNFRSPYSDRTTPSPSWTKYTSCRSPFRKKVSFGIDSVGLEMERVVRVPWTIALRPRIASPSCGMRPVKMWYGWRTSASGGKSGAREKSAFRGGLTCSVGYDRTWTLRDQAPLKPQEPWISSRVRTWGMA